MQTLIVERAGAVAVVTLNRPDVLNALNLQMLAELRETIAGFDADDSLRAVILTGAGAKAFAAGADIAELHALGNARAGEEQARRGQALTASLERLRVPVIAAVNGYAFGGGLEMANRRSTWASCRVTAERSARRACWAKAGQCISA